MNKIKIIFLTILISSCGFKYNPITNNKVLENFNIESPEDLTKLTKLNLHSTFYYTPQLANIPNGIDIRDKYDKPLGVKLSKDDWCTAALEGSFTVNHSRNFSSVSTISNQTATFNYATTTNNYYVDCNSYGSPYIGFSKFKKAIGKYGDGVKNYKLIPYRTIAVDPKFLPIGKLIYIPKARGIKFKNDQNKTITHDGYFFSADQGGIIKNNHIDIFIGNHTVSPFKFRNNEILDAYIIEESEMKDVIQKQHL